ncbi:hypothetical protein ACFLUL_00715 [Chloroflexota bacterium]
MEYLYIGITALIIIVLFLLFLRNREKQPRKLSNLTTLGMTLVVLGIIFIDAGRLISYSFFGVAVLLSIIDIIRIHKNKESSI